MKKSERTKVYEEVEKTLEESNKLIEDLDNFIDKHDKNKFDKTKYNIEYKKNTYRKFACDLKKEEWTEIDEVLKQKGINKAEFVRAAFKNIDKIL